MINPIEESNRVIIWLAENSESVGYDPTVEAGKQAYS